MKNSKYKFKLGQDIHGDYALLTIKRRKVWIDANQLDLILQYRWYITEHGYAKTKIEGRPVSMQALLLQPRAGMTVDHIDQVKLNNRLYNLRFAEHRQNVANGKRRQCNGRRMYPYLGIGKAKGKWFAKLGYKHRDFCYAKFNHAWEAGLAYDIMACIFNGEFAALNFPKDDPRLPGIKARLPIDFLMAEKARIDSQPIPPKPKYRGIYIAGQEPLRFSYDFRYRCQRFRGKTYVSEEAALAALNQKYLELGAPHRIQEPKAYRRKETSDKSDAA